ncbi:CHAT domain-containing protein [Prolixibacter bellariivorans]|uniref:CHAT domain-containing protein n=1 Tax=Prolixibacter bellariivorans TaxID=314319 RepID=UPI000470513D|nr:CHAT domain-containing tetratricopeptide repeat protein [Prolixibacter bellariivorans]
MRLSNLFFHLNGRILILVSLILLSIPTWGEVDSNQQEDHYSEGVSEFRNFNFEDALAQFKLAVQDREEQYGKMSKEVANVYSNIGIILKQVGREKEAIDYYSKAEKIYQELGESALPNLATLYINIGFLYIQNGDFNTALTYLENSKSIFEKTEQINSPAYLTLLLNLTTAYTQLRRFNDAFNVASELKAGSDNVYAVLSYYESVGFINLRMDNYSDALKSLFSALEYGKSNLGENFYHQENILTNIGMCYLNSEDYDKAFPYFNKSLKLANEKFGQKNGASPAILVNMGMVYMGKSAKASDISRFLVEKRAMLLKSLDYFQQALIAISPDFNEKDWTKNPDVQNSFSNSQMLEILKRKADALRQLAEVETNSGEKETALKYLKNSLSTYEKAIDVIHLLRNGYLNQDSKLALAENEQATYFETVDVATKLYEKTGERHYLEQAFQVSERGKSATFLSALRDLKAQKFGGIPDSLRNQEETLKSEISAYKAFIFNENNKDKPDSTKLGRWQSKVYELEQNYSDLIHLFEQNYPNYYNLKYSDDVVTVKKLQNYLKHRDALIEYAVNEPENGKPGELITFFVTSQKCEVKRQVLNDNYNKEINAFLGFLRNPDVLNTNRKTYSEYARSAYSLYKLLVEPFAREIQGYRLIFIPDNKLAYLPFDGMISAMPDTTHMDFRKLHYLIKDYPISYSYSATLLYQYFKSDATAPRNLIAFAPDYSKGATVDINAIRDGVRENLSPLPGAKEEVEGITKLISGDVFDNNKATESNFKKDAGNYDILHLAMHTILNDSLPMYSKLVFSPENDSINDGWLNTYEVYNMKLKARLAVLSACNTGSGKLRKGEGVVSLARGFLYAGCPSIVMTLWNVEDVSSAKLMINFYKYLLKGYSKDEALRKAKLDHLANADPLKAHPYYWLGYVLIGDQTPLFSTKVPYFIGLIIVLLFVVIGERFWVERRRKRRMKR